MIKLFTTDAVACNLGQNICRLFHFLAQFLFTTSETEPDYYHQKVNAYELLNDLRLKDPRKFENFKKNPEMLEFDGEYPAGYPKAKF